MHSLVVAGARPNFVKVAPVLAALERGAHSISFVHTGQHYDTKMSGALFEDLGLPTPDYHLNVGSGTHAQQTARVMEAFEPVLLKERPDWVIVVGDVNSTIACALVTAKLRPQIGSRLAHVEAGLRSNDWRMPEEVNRVLTDRLSDLLLTPSRDATPNILAEGLDPARIVFVGNVMIDTLMSRLPAARGRGLPGRLGLSKGGFVIATLHRPSNVDDPKALAAILRAFREVNEVMPVVLPIHPRTRQAAERFGLAEDLHALRSFEPLGYLDMLSLTESAAVCLTDSGGLQEETTALGIPCVTLREQTERPVTVTQGTNQLASWPLSPAGIVANFHSAIAGPRWGVGERVPDGWDGHAADRIVDALLNAMKSTHPTSEGE